jgi:hypothetical protein
LVFELGLVKWTFFGQLKLLAELALRKHQHVMKANPTPVTKSDFGDPDKWSMADIADHGKAIRQLQLDFSATKAIREQFLQSVQEIESDMLQGSYFVSVELFAMTNSTVCSNN